MWMRTMLGCTSGGREGFAAPILRETERFFFALCSSCRHARRSKSFNRRDRGDFAESAKREPTARVGVAPRLVGKARCYWIPTFSRLVDRE